MTVKHLFRFVILVCLYSCTANTADGTSTIFKTQSGPYIENGPRQGFQYFDSIMTEYNYRYYTMTITNDSIVPIHLVIYFPKTAELLMDKYKSKVFLLPRHLTPKEQHFDHGISKELKIFLDSEIDKSEHLDKILSPTEKYTMTFGFLTSTKYPDPTTPFNTKLLTSNENSSTILFKLKVNDTLIIPCGQFSYAEK